MGPGNLWIVVLGFNGLDDTRRCLTSLAAVAGGPPNAVYVDNASAVGVPETIEAAFPWCHVVRNATNDGYAGGNNRGIAYALEHGAQLVLMLNNDTVVAPQLCDTMRRVSEAHSDFGILGPVIGFAAEPSIVMTDGCRFNARAAQDFFSRQPVPLSAGSEIGVDETDIVNGCCLMARAEVFRSVGMFDERFFLVHEESDFCLRARTAGFKLGVVDRMLVWHKGSSSFKRTGRKLQLYFDVRNLALLLRTRKPFGGIRRSAPRTWFEYWRYAYHRFCLEYEAGETLAAAAVLEGLDDAVMGQSGPYQERARHLVGLLWGIFLSGRAIMALAPRSPQQPALKERP